MLAFSPKITPNEEAEDGAAVFTDLEQQFSPRENPFPTEHVDQNMAAVSPEASPYLVHPDVEAGEHKPNLATNSDSTKESSTSTRSVRFHPSTVSGKHQPFKGTDNFTQSQRARMLCSRDDLYDDNKLCKFRLTQLLHQLQEDLDENPEVLQEIMKCDEKEKQILAMYWYYHSQPLPLSSEDLLDKLTDGKFIEMQTKHFLSFLPTHRDGVQIHSLSDLLRCYYIPFRYFCLGIVIQSIQFLAYISIILFYVDQEKSALTNLKLFSLLFASVSLAMAGMSNFTPLLLVRHAKTLFNHLPIPNSDVAISNKFPVAHALAKQKSRFFYNIAHSKRSSQLFVDILTAFECINLTAIFVATYILLPLLGTPFGIILNATVIFLVHQLDEQVFSVWKLTLEDKYYIDNPIQEEFVIRTFRIRELSVAFAAGLYIAIVFFY